MVPTDYRLDRVVARLIERLEGTRRSYVGDEDLASAELQRISEAHLAAAIGEFREVALSEDPDRHAAFLRQELVHTFLPRYKRLALEMTALEDRGFGLGPLADPLGRIALLVVSVFLFFFFGRVALSLPMLWPFVMVLMALPFAPDITGTLYRRRYRRRLEAVVADMTVIQEQATAYMPAKYLKTEAPQAHVAPRPNPQREET